MSCRPMRGKTAVKDMSDKYPLFTNARLTHTLERFELGPQVPVAPAKIYPPGYPLANSGLDRFGLDAAGQRKRHFPYG